MPALRPHSSVAAPVLLWKLNGYENFRADVAHGISLGVHVHTNERP
jgi:hypothetical protein